VTISDSQPLACLDIGPTEPQQLTDTEVAAVAKALGNPTRLQMVAFFQDQCPRNVGDMVAELPLAQSTVSKHLQILRKSGIVHTVRDESRVWMCMNRSVLRGFADHINSLTDRDSTTRIALQPTRTEATSRTPSR